MTNPHDEQLRAALLRLGTGPSRSVEDVPLPPLFRNPAIALLWMTLVIIVVGVLALGRLRVPRVAQGVAVAVDTNVDSAALLLLLPAAAAPYVRPGQRATLDSGDGQRVVLDFAAIDSAPIDAGSARRRYPASPHLLAHLDTPKVAVTLARCAADRPCLTPLPGVAYRATASLGTRTLASYAWSSTPPFAR